MNRRTFLRSLAYGLGGALPLNQIKTDAAAPGGEKLPGIGLQLYTVRKNMGRDFEGTLRQVAALGIKEVEFAGYFNRPPKQIKSVLDSLALAAPSAHLDTETLRRSLPRAIEDAGILGHRYLILGYLPEGERKSLVDYEKLTELLDRSGEECRRAGLQFVYHNHDFEFVRTGGKIPYDLILENTSGQNVKMELDLYWISKAGFSPLAYFERHPGRFPLVHVKDMDDTRKKSFTEVGRGVIDFGKIFSGAKRAGIRHYFIEQDETPADPFESVKISLKYLRSLKF